MSTRREEREGGHGMILILIERERMNTQRARNESHLSPDPRPFPRSWSSLPPSLHLPPYIYFSQKRHPRPAERFLPQLDEFYVTTADTHRVEYCPCNYVPEPQIVRSLPSLGGPRTVKIASSCNKQTTWLHGSAYCHTHYSQRRRKGCLKFEVLKEQYWSRGAERGIVLLSVLVLITCRHSIQMIFFHHKQMTSTWAVIQDQMTDTWV
jgi:hypothetical protein